MLLGEVQESIRLCAEVLCDDGIVRFATLLARALIRSPGGEPGWAYLLRYNAGRVWGDTHAWCMYVPDALRPVPCQRPDPAATAAAEMAEG